MDGPQKIKIISSEIVRSAGPGSYSDNILQTTSNFDLI